MAEINYLDFDLQIERAEGGYRAQVLYSPAGQPAANFALPFSDAELESFVVNIGQANMEAAKSFGRRLFEAAFSDEIRSCLRSSISEAGRQGAGLRIRLRLTQAPELMDWPWEFLYYGALNRFLALSTETPLVYYLDLPEGVGGSTIRPPINVLAIIPNASDYPTLDVEREWAKLNEAMQTLVQGGLVSIERLDQPTLKGLQRKLRQGEYHVIHFVGHGGFDPQSQEGVLIMEDDQRKGQLVKGSDLGMLLHDERTLRLVVLNACHGARASRADPFSGVAQSLIQQGISAIIGMQFEISDNAAITFAREFYGALADRYPADAALAEARKAMSAGGSSIEWGTPVLYMRAPNGRIFDLQPATAEPPLAPAAKPVEAPAPAAAVPVAPTPAPVPVPPLPSQPAPQSGGLNLAMMGGIVGAIVLIALVAFVAWPALRGASVRPTSTFTPTPAPTLTSVPLATWSPTATPRPSTPTSTPTLPTSTPTAPVLVRPTATRTLAANVIGPVGSGDLEAVWTSAGNCTFQERPEGNLRVWFWEADFYIEVHGGRAGYTIDSPQCRWDFALQKYVCRFSAREGGAVVQSLTVNCPGCRPILVPINQSARRGRGNACELD